MNERLSTIHTTELVESKENNALHDFVVGLSDGAFNQPLKAIKQLTGSSNEHDRTQEKNSATIQNSSYNVGQIVGSLVPFAALGIITRGASNRLFCETLMPSFGRTVAEHATNGFLLGSILTPSKESTGQSILSSRLHQGLNSAITFALMGGASRLAHGALPQFSGRAVAIAALSGSAGGVVEAELKSGFQASKQELLSSAIGYAVFGTAMESAGLYTRRILNLPENSPNNSRVEDSIRGSSPPPGARASRPLLTDTASPAKTPLSNTNHTPSIETFNDPNGRVTIIDKKSGSNFLFNKERQIIAASQVDSRDFHYDDQGNIDQINSLKLGRIQNYDGRWYTDLGINTNGRRQLKFMFKGDLLADNDGSIRAVDSDGAKIKVYGIDGSTTVYPKEGRSEVIAADYHHELNSLKSKVWENFVGPNRIHRMMDLIADFEKESDSRGLDEHQRALFYRQLNKLLADSPNAVLPLDERCELAEQVLNHAAFPTTIDQGLNNTCNVTTVENRIYSRSPAEMARLISDVVNDGIYTSTEGIKINALHGPTKIAPDQEALECVKHQMKGMSDVKIDGRRDWSSQIAQTTMVKISMQQRGNFYILHDRLLSPSDLAWNANKELMGIVNPRFVEPVFNARGQRISVLPLGQKAYRQDGLFRQEVNPFDLVYDDCRRLQGCLVDRSRLTELYDYFGNRIRDLRKGQTAYFKDGMKGLYVAAPGEVKYEKFIDDPSKEVERMYLDHDGKRILLKRRCEDGKVRTIDEPLLYAEDLRWIANSITGTENAPFAVRRDRTFRTSESMIAISTKEELETTLKKLQSENNLPAVLRVNTANKLFAKYGKIGDNGGGHVINFHGYDLNGKRVSITNQWGSSCDFTDPGIPLDDMFELMNEPKNS